VPETAAAKCLSDNCVLIVAASGRMLARSALRAGIVPFVIDLYADLDTQCLAKSYQHLNTLEAAVLAPAVKKFQLRFNLSNVIYGSGLENYPESVDYLDAKLNLLGNSAAEFRQVQDKQYFFNVLHGLAIPFPEVFFSEPPKQQLCLQKPVYGEGGMGIIFGSSSQTDSKGVYWQQHIDGVPMSVLFIADGQHVNTVGFNRQWTTALDIHQQFVFAGAINQADLPEAEKIKLEHWLAKLVPVLSLKGMNSLDFIWDGSSSWILEINPRPSASMMLYDADFAKGLLHEHMQSCISSIEATNFTAKKVRAFEILYADRDFEVSDEFTWPRWSMNQPAPGCLIRNKQPICSIIAAGNCAGNVVDKLQTRKQIIINEMNKSK
jgi:uncharacterized protein